MRRPTSSLLLPFVRLVVLALSHSVSGRRLDCAPPWRSLLLRPRGPRSSPGYSVPNRHHLFGLIRPTRRHIAISPHGGLYAMPSLCGSAEATREWFRTFTAHSFLACRPLRPRGVQHRYVPELRCRHGLRRLTTGSALPILPQSVPRGFPISWLHWFASATACQVARPPVRIGLDRPAFGDFYFQAFNGSVSLSVAGYNYNSSWISFCWRDLHPLEWQLASLHGQTRKSARLNGMSVLPPTADVV
jgi:hypothetical protein